MSQLYCLAVGRALAAPGKRRAKGAEPARQALLRLRKRLSEVQAIDFFAAPGRDTVEGLLARGEARLRPTARDAAAPSSSTPGDVRGRTWVTRRGIHVHRMASAWLIRRFIDPEARFEFVPGNEYAPRHGELRFDMFQAEFTHDGLGLGVRPALVGGSRTRRRTPRPRAPSSRAWT